MLTLVVFSDLLQAETRLKIDFTKDQELTNWYVVVDQVMGGRSRGELSFSELGARFVGTVSLQNNGGFASIRSEYSSFELSMFEEVEIRYRATGVGFAFTLNNHRRYYMPRFKHPLNETDGQWVTAVLKFSDFRQVRLGEVMEGHLDKNLLSNVIRLGVISNDKRATGFALDIAYIEFR